MQPTINTVRANSIGLDKKSETSEERAKRTFKILIENKCIEKAQPNSIAEPTGVIIIFQDSKTNKTRCALFGTLNIENAIKDIVITALEYKMKKEKKHVN